MIRKIYHEWVIDQRAIKNRRDIFIPSSVSNSMANAEVPIALFLLDPVSNDFLSVFEALPGEKWKKGKGKKERKNEKKKIPSS